jgi:hypothetical protein
MTLTLLPFIPKDDQALPDCYGLTVVYHSGPNMELELVDHRILPSAVLSYVTKQDTFGFVPLTAIKHVYYDKRYSKLIAMNMERNRKEQEAAAQMSQLAKPDVPKSD